MRTVDVVVPCYNYGHFLPGCVASILDQQRVEVRICVIDDCSTDDSLDVARRLAADDPRIEVIAHQQNKGHLATYNEGLLEWTTADYTVLISADDLMTPGCLDRAVDIMEANPSVGMVYGRPLYFQTGERPEATGRHRGHTIWPGHIWAGDRCRAGFNVISSPEVVMRGDIQRKVGGYRADFPHAGDLEMWLRVAAVADIAYVKGVPQAYYRIHSASMLRNQADLTDLTERGAVFDHFCDEHRDVLTNAAQLKRLSRRALAREALWRAARAYDHGDPDGAPVDKLVDFALRTYDDSRSLGEYRALQRRLRLGPTVCHKTQLFAGTAAVKKAQNWLWWRKWERTGV